MPRMRIKELIFRYLCDTCGYKIDRPRAEYKVFPCPICHPEVLQKPIEFKVEQPHD